MMNGDTPLCEEKSTCRSKTNSSEKLDETSYVRETTNEEHVSDAQLVPATVPAEAESAKSTCVADDGRTEAAAVEEAEEESSGDHGTAVAAEEAAVTGKGRRASAAQALLLLTIRGALALVAADVLVGRPLQYVASITARFWAVGFIVGAVFFLTAASVGNQWRRQVNIHPSEMVTDDCPQEQQLVLQIPAENQQTAETHFPVKSSNKIKQSVCEDIVPHKSSDNSSESHFLTSLNENAVVI